MSIRGAFIFAPLCPPVGAAVGLTASVPTFSDLTGCLRIAGRVVRIERRPSDGAIWGFAISGDKITSLDSEDGDAAN